MEKSIGLELRFAGKYDAVICLDADFPSKEFFLKMANVPLLAADGAAIRLYELGIDADYIIGDLDTFYKSGLQKKFDKNKLIFEPSQDSNDFEKALNFSIGKNYFNLLIIGFHGGELEHTLNNWSVLQKYSGKLNLCVYDKSRYIIPIHHSSFETKLLIDELVSLIPMPKALLITKGFQWDLNSEWLEIGIREGARNKALECEISIEIIEGAILFIINERLPFAPIFHY